MSYVISAIVVNYNAGSLLRSCIDSIINCPLSVQIIIVDNASTDGSLDSLADLKHVEIIRNDRNQGFAAACNSGIRIATAENILFLNPDCTFPPGTLDILLTELHADSRVGMVGALLTNLDGSEQAGARRAIPTPWRSFVRAFGLARFETRWPKLFFDFHLHKQPLPDQSIEVEAISGACMLVRREAIKDVGEWDEGYFLHCEDLDWCMRFRQKQWKILFVPSAHITHALGVCSRNRRLFVEWHKHKGMMRFYRKFFQHQYPGGLMFFVGVAVWMRFIFVAAYLLIKKLVLPRMGAEIGVGRHDIRSPSQFVSCACAGDINTTAFESVESGWVGVLGATSLVGHFLLPLLDKQHWKVVAYSRHRDNMVMDGVEWRRLSSSTSSVGASGGNGTAYWISLAPIAVLPNYFEMILQSKARRVVVLSSTSRFVKAHSSDTDEQLLARQLGEGEAVFSSWAASHGIEWVILRPTLIYGRGLDKNISEIARFVRRFGFFPLLGKAKGLRQPIYAEDVALSCIASLTSPAAGNRVYNISGGDTLSYRDMVSRVFLALEKQPRFITIPLAAFRFAVAVARIFPRYRNWSSAMAERMNQDLVFDHSEAEKDLKVKPRGFKLSQEDVSEQ